MLERANKKMDRAIDDYLLNLPGSEEYIYRLVSRAQTLLITLTLILLAITMIIYFFPFSR